MFGQRCFRGDCLKSSTGVDWFVAVFLLFFCAVFFIDSREAREWIANCVNWYNTEHHHSALDYVTPHEKRFGKAEKIYAKRNKFMQKIRAKNPEIWGKRNAKRWGGPDAVFLNPEKDKKDYEKTRQLC